jgi:peptide deformylase
MQITHFENVIDGVDAPQSAHCKGYARIAQVILKLFEAGELVLRRPSRELTPEEIVSAPIQDLIGSMYETMRAAPGVGLAAPQIGMPLQLAVIEDRQEFIDKLPPEHAATRLRSAVAPHVIVNPRLTFEAGENVEFFEGCLSLPGFTAIVPRAPAVRVDCLNERAEPVTIYGRGWYARILQHEIDHLHGTLYVDRMLTRSFMGRENFERYWKDVPAGEFRRLTDA